MAITDLFRRMRRSPSKSRFLRSRQSSNSPGRNVSLSIEPLEERRLLVVGALAPPDPIAPGTGFDGVVDLTITRAEGNFICTGNLLEGGRHILTAAHCVTDGNGAVNTTDVDVTFEMPSGDLTFDTNLPAMQFHPSWTGATTSVGDLAILELVALAPFDAEEYGLYSARDELGQTFTLVGYGATGTGATGEQDGTTGTKRMAQNQVGLILGSGSQLQADFDDGTPANNPLGDTLGLGANEGDQAGGDSGGSTMLIGSQVMGVASYSSDLNESGNSSDFGDSFTTTRVSSFIPYISGIRDAALPLIIDMNLQEEGNDGSADSVTLRRSGLDFQIVLGGVVQYSTLMAEITSIVYLGSDDDDQLIVDFSGGNPIPAGGIDFDGGDESFGGGDDLVLRGGTFTNATFNYTNLHDGDIDLDGSTITYTGLEPITSTITATNVTLNYSNMTELITLTQVAAGTTQVNSTAGEVTTFADPAAKLTINAGGGNDSFAIPAGTYSYSLYLDGGAGTEAISLDGLIINAGGAADGLNIDNIETVAVSNSRFTNNPDDGVQIRDASTSVSLTNVTSTDNNWGLFLTGTNGPVMLNEGHYDSNDVDGILSFSGVASLIATNVSASNNDRHGVNIGSLDGPVTFSGGQYNNNGEGDPADGGDGIHLSNVGAVVTTDNVTATGNDPGIFIDTAASYTDTDGNFSNNDNHGIHLIDISGNVSLTRTTADNNDADDDGVGDGLRSEADANAFGIGGTLTILGSNFRDTDGPLDGVWQDNGVLIRDGVQGNVRLADEPGGISNTITGNDDDGFDLEGADNADVTITNGTFSGNGTDGGGTGIEIDNADVVTINTVTADGNFSNGLDVDPTNVVNVNGGTFNFNGSDGIELDDIGGVNISSVTAIFNGDDGLDVASSGQVFVTGGTFFNNDDNGIELTGLDRATVASVDASVNLNNGLQGSEIGVVTISGGIYEANTIDGINLFGVETIIIKDDTLAIDNINGDGVDIDEFTNATLSFLTTNDNGDLGAEISNGERLDVNDWVTIGNNNDVRPGNLFENIGLVNFETTTRPDDTADKIEIFETDFQHTRAIDPDNPIKQDFVEYIGIGVLNFFTLGGMDVFVVHSNVNNRANALDINLDGGAPSAGPNARPGDKLVMTDFNGIAAFTDPFTGTGLASAAGGFDLIDFTDIEEIVVADEHEFNDTLVTATVLGSDMAILTGGSIHNINDEDFYKVTAKMSGVLQFNLFTTFGTYMDLDMQILDADGSVIATLESEDHNEFVAIPVVAQKMYFVRVFGKHNKSGGCDFGNYDLEIENTPILTAPDAVHLDPNSDTGMMSDDNVTMDTTPRFIIQADLSDLIDPNNDGVDDLTVLTPTQADNKDPGLAVWVTITDSADGTVKAEGFATQLGTSSLFDFTPDFLDDGIYFISAAVKVIDGSTPSMDDLGPQSVPLWFTIDDTAPVGTRGDLLASSDTGMFDDDNVTNKMSPAFSGTGEPNSKVRVFAATVVETVVNGQPVLTEINNQLVGQGVVTSEGDWEVTVEPLADAKYNITVVYEDLAGNVSAPIGVTTTMTNNTAERITDFNTTTSSIDVAGLEGTVVDVDITLNIQHMLADDLDIFLTSPAGTIVQLSNRNDGGMDYTDTTFDDEAGSSIVGNPAPHTGVFRPQGSLSGFDGEDPNGIWTLSITDNAFPNVGRLLNWTLQLITPDPLMIVVDTEAPNTPHLDLLAATDSGRHDADNITLDTTPNLNMTSEQPNVALAELLGFTDNLKYRIFDRAEGAAEVLIFDSAADSDADDISTANDMFTAATNLIRTLPLAEGVHNLKLEVEDRAGNISHDFLLTVTVDETPPPVSFGLPGNSTDGLRTDSDSGVVTFPDTADDRITNDTSPTFWGLAEADAIVELFVDKNNDGKFDADDIFLGRTVAIPNNGNHAFANGFWEITSVLDLNDSAISADLDGLRNLLVRATDVAGNVNKPDGETADDDQKLEIFLDTQAPRVLDVFATVDPNYSLFDPKPSVDGPTPLIDGLTVRFMDAPERGADPFKYSAAIKALLEVPGNYALVGDHTGTVFITSATVDNNEVVITGSNAAADVKLTFSAALADDRYTLTVSDAIADRAGNRLDGESQTAAPFNEDMVVAFPSGDRLPGGDFVARFTVDSRPEIGSFASGSVTIDINGNFVWDPEGQDNDATNRDLTFTLPVTNNGQLTTDGFSVHDALFAGNFAPLNGTADGFDKLAAFGRLNGQFRFIVDTNNDGVVDTSQGDIFQLQNPNIVIDGLPFAGNFDGNAANGDEVGLYNAGAWFLDTNRNFIIEPGEQLAGSNMLGYPIVGDFDGDGADDLAVFNNDVFYFDLNRNGTFDVTLNWGFSGVGERPVAADMNQDGIDDIGLWVPRNSASLPQEIAEWFFLVSDASQANAGTVDALNHPFETVPFGDDLAAMFGDELALPILGNFDPPATGPTSSYRFSSSLGGGVITAEAVSGAAVISDGAISGGLRSAGFAVPQTAVVASFFAFDRRDVGLPGYGNDGARTLSYQASFDIAHSSDVNTLREGRQSSSRLNGRGVDRAFSDALWIGERRLGRSSRRSGESGDRRTDRRADEESLEGLALRQIREADRDDRHEALGWVFDELGKEPTRSNDRHVEPSRAEQNEAQQNEAQENEAKAPPEHIADAG